MADEMENYHGISLVAAECTALQEVEGQLEQIFILDDRLANCNFCVRDGHVTEINIEGLGRRRLEVSPSIGDRTQLKEPIPSNRTRITANKA